MCKWELFVVCNHSDKFVDHRHCGDTMFSIYIAYKSLFESLKKKSKKNYYIRRLENFKNDKKKSWGVIKEIIGRAKSAKGSFL